MISAPFSTFQVDSINQFQAGVNSLSPFSAFACGCNHNSPVRPLFIASKTGLTCPSCGDTQHFVPEYSIVPALDCTEARIAQAFAEDGADPCATMLDRIDARIDSYEAIFQAHAPGIDNTLAEIEESSRIRYLVPIMLESLRKRRLSCLGVGIRDKKVSFLDASWIALNKQRPRANSVVDILIQDDQEIFNPIHYGYGCGAWVSENMLEYVCTSGEPTHWRPINRSDPMLHA